MDFYIFAALLAAIVVVCIPIIAAGKGWCPTGETRIACLREWMKAMAPLAIFTAATFAAFAAIGAWQNLQAVQREAAVPIAEILRHRLAGLQREYGNWATIENAMREDAQLFESLADPPIEWQGWPESKSAQQTNLNSASQLLRKLQQILLQQKYDVDTGELSTPREAFVVASFNMKTKVDGILQGPKSQDQIDVKAWRALFSDARDDKDYKTAMIAYSNIITLKISELRNRLAQTEKHINGTP